MSQGKTMGRRLGIACIAAALLAGCSGGSESTSPGGGGAGPDGGLPDASGGAAGQGGGVGEMVSVPAAGNGSYRIDRTEVTRAAYALWLAANPSPEGQPTECAWNDSYEPEPQCMADTSVCQGDACSGHPQVCVDWCDAYAYCQGVGKRLCGKIGGGKIDFDDDYADASKSQWYNACSSGGTHAYCYGDTYANSTCNGTEYGAGSTVQVGSLEGCQSSEPSYAGVLDLTGNVLEWEDSSTTTTPIPEVPDPCRLRGGSYNLTDGLLSCENGFFDNRDVHHPDIGFRCCE
jgi:formylglycine-generating enzyme required for sulfatase activity